MANIISKMEIFTTDFGLKMSNMVKELCFNITRIDMLVNGRIVNVVGKVDIAMPMDLSMKDNEKMK